MHVFACHSNSGVGLILAQSVILHILGMEIPYLIPNIGHHYYHETAI